MRITEIFALGGGCDYGCRDPYKGYYKDDYIYGGYPRYFHGYKGGYYDKHYYYVAPACLYGSRFY